MGHHDTETGQKSQRRKLRICFVALNAYPVIDPKVSGSFGGIETRSWLFARTLAKHPDFEVSFLVRHWNSLRSKSYEGVQIHLLRDQFYLQRNSLHSRLQRFNRFPWIHLQSPQLSDAFYLPFLVTLKYFRKFLTPLDAVERLHKIDTDLFLAFGVHTYSAKVIAAGKASQRPVVLFLGSDGDLDENYVSNKEFVSVYRDRADVCLWAIQNADQVLCQTSAQQQRLHSLFQRDGILVRNPMDIAQWDEQKQAEIDPALHGNLSRYALWVGRAEATHKRPQLLLELARLCPDVQFLMIMNPLEIPTEAAVKVYAPQNVTIVDHVPFHAMPAVFAKAALLVNTSSLEGFPNTFLQASVSGVPIASLNVEVEFLRDSQSGFYAEGNIASLAEYVRNTWHNNTISHQGRPYVQEHHDLQRQTDLLAETLKLVKFST